MEWIECSWIQLVGRPLSSQAGDIADGGQGVRLIHQHNFVISIYHGKFDAF